MSAKIKNKKSTLVGTLVSATITNPIVTPIIVQIDRWRNKRKREKSIPKKVEKSEATELQIPHEKESVIVPGTEVAKVALTEQDREFAANLLSQFVEQGIEKASFTGLLTCDVDISGLIPSADGCYRGLIKDPINGDISGAVQLSEVGIPTPLLVFQLASMITGQYYQEILTRHLESIDAKLDYIVDTLETNKESKIKTCYKTVKRLWKTDTYNDPDISSIERNRDEMYSGLEATRAMIRKIVPNAKRGFSDKEEVKNWVAFLDSSRFFYHMELACHYERLYHACTLLLIKAYQNDPKRAEGYCEDLKDLKVGRNEIQKKYHEVKVVVTENIKELSRVCLLGEDKIEKHLEELSDEFERIENLYKETQKEQELPPYLLKFTNGELTNKYIIRND